MEKGEKTPQYKAIKSNYTGLISSLEPVLRRVTAKCFEKDLISTTERDRANDQRDPEAVRSGGLVDAILKKIKSNIKWYDVLMEILKEFTELEDIERDITRSFTTTSGSSSGSGDITTSFTTASGSSSGSGDITTSFTAASGSSSRSGEITTSFTAASGSSSRSGMH